MASLNNLKKRIGGVKSINQITSAMELVAATKMRKAQEAALASRFYAFDALEILGNVTDYLVKSGAELEKTFFARTVEKTLILIVTSDKGLVGSFNSSIIKKVEKFLKENADDFKAGKFSFMTVGQKGTDFVRRLGITPAGHFSNYGDIIDVGEIEELAGVLDRGYQKREWDRIVSFSMNFTSALSQEVVERRILPFEAKQIRKTVEEVIPNTGRYSNLKAEISKRRATETLDYIMEPSPKEILDDLLPHLLKIQVYHLMLEANASEHSSRRVTMKNASDNAHELTNELTLAYNKTRQEMITKELGELTGTVAAITNNV